MPTQMDNLVPSAEYRSCYNQLPDVLDATNRLQARDKPGTLDALAKVILEHGLQEQVGIRLLHKHNTVETDELMIEAEEVDPVCETKSLTTLADEAGQIHRRYGEAFAPNSWRWVGQKWLPLEYSVDSKAVHDSRLLQKMPKFAMDFAEGVDRLDARDLLGPCLVRRNFFEGYAAVTANGAMLVETTDASRRANILRFVDRAAYRPENLLQTVWRVVDRVSAGSSCITLCGIHCEIYFSCAEDNSGGHFKQVEHDRSHIESH